MRWTIKDFYLIWWRFYIDFLFLEYKKNDFVLAGIDTGGRSGGFFVVLAGLPKKRYILTI